MGGEESNQIPPDDRQPDPIDALKSEIESLRKSVDKVIDSQQQIDESQNKLVKSIVSASRVAQETADDLVKTKAEFLTAFQGIQGKAITPDIIKDGMKSFADEIAKATDVKLTAFMDSFAQQPAAGQQGGQMVRQGGGSMTDIVAAVMPYADTILKIIQALKPQPPAVAPLSDFLIQHRRYNEFEKAFGSKDMPIDEFAKAAKATFDTPYKPPA